MLKPLLLFLLICTTSWSQTIKGIYTTSPLKGIGDDTELSDLAKNQLILPTSIAIKLHFKKLR